MRAARRGWTAGSAVQGALLESGREARRERTSPEANNTEGRR